MSRIPYVLVVATFLIGCGSPEADTAETAPPALTSGQAADPADTAIPWDSAALILDVRTPEEWAEGHVEGATHIPVDQLESRLAEIRQYQQQPIVVYCRTGRRSAAAIEVLRNNGFTRLENGGGLEDMLRAGAPRNR